jgi:nickel/cobalt transporter (NicO) family protein
MLSVGGLAISRSFLVTLLAWMLAGSSFLPSADAHPVPRRAHDRTIVVRLSQDKVIIDYRLEVDEFTVVYEDLPAFSDQIDLTRLTRPEEFYEAFTRCYAPVLAGNLVAKVDGKPLTFTWEHPRYTLRDEQGQKLGHLRCDFRFEADTGVVTDRIRQGDSNPHEFHFRETNYELEEGRIRLSLVGSEGVQFQKKIEPDLKLQESAPSELKPGDDAKLRTVKCTFFVSDAARGADATPLAEPTSSVARAPGESSSLLDLLLDPNRGFWMLLGLAAFFGAVHALAPGHGKTLVAAYLVGEQGTIWHALILGLVTTLTHTGAVLALAGILLIVNPEKLPNLEFFGGLLVAGMGLWLLLRRLAGQADHIHLGGHHHHDQLAAELAPRQANAPVAGGWGGLIALGISGGIVPCYDAIIMLIFAVSARRVWLALPLLLAFSAGLAGVLILIGILVVQSRRLIITRRQEGAGQGKMAKWLPILSALLVIMLGLFLCYRSVHSAAE